MPYKSEQTEIEIEIIDINRFIIRRSCRKCVQISHCKSPKWIAFDTKIRFEVLPGCVSKCLLPHHSSQNRAVQDDQEADGNRDANHHATPDVPVAPVL